MALDGALARMRRLVELESPSHDEAGLRAVAAVFAAELSSVGAAVETVDVPGVGEHVIGRIDGREAAPPVLVLGHLDTVHPVGAFDPVFELEDGRIRGPGVYDMKGGLACALEALHRLDMRGSGPRRSVIFLATCDEETGSEHSRPLIEELARESDLVLVPEPSLPGGGAKTRRSGVGLYDIEVTGRAAHAGVAPEDGINAIEELAHQLLATVRLARPERGTTINVGRVEGGTASNVVPASARAEVDVRFASEEEGARVDAALRGLEPVLEGAKLDVTGGVNRPPLERTAAVAELYETARALAAEAGWALGEGASGGGSDGSFTAALGIPTLDGLGPLGDGAHALSEHVVAEDLARRVDLYARLLEVL